MEGERRRGPLARGSKPGDALCQGSKTGDVLKRGSKPGDALRLLLAFSSPSISLSSLSLHLGGKGLDGLPSPSALGSFLGEPAGGPGSSDGASGACPLASAPGTAPSPASPVTRIVVDSADGGRAAEEAKKGLLPGAELLGKEGGAVAGLFSREGLITILTLYARRPTT
ncbi:MAG: hypothetical protein FRX49_08666 [Trebouxia sp. A1-2]|nr:MAG: hypothetical protein FRX49_08666 [Trebouxia sp. A1-2]